MSDFSSFALFTAGLAIFARTASAAAPTNLPGGSAPTAGAVTAPDGSSKVTAGTPFAITWAGKEAGCGKTVDLVLLKGPSSSQMSALSYIAQGVSTTANTYSWTPGKDTEPSTTDYGIELVCVDTKAYQYTTRFGIANADYKASTGSSSSSSASASSSATASVSGYGSSSTTTSESKTKDDKTSSTTAKYPIGTGSPGSAYGNATEPKSTGGVTQSTATITTSATGGSASGSSSKTTSATKSASTSSQTGAAGHLAAGFGGLAAAAAVAVYAL